MLSDAPTPPHTPQARRPGGDDKQEEDQCERNAQMLVEKQTKYHENF